MRELLKALTILYICLVVSVVKAETTPGYDVLGVAMYCDRYLAAPPLPAVSTLLNTFGDPLPCIEQRIQRGGIKIVQVDLIDATCWRNGVCPPGVPRPDDTREITKRAAQVLPLANKYPAVDFWVSSALEHDVKDSNRVKAMMQAAQAGCPKCKVIQSPMSGSVVAGYPVERHGTTASAFSISGDGSSIFDGDNIRSDGNGFEHRTAGSFTTFAWFNELNLRCSGEKSFTPPKQRTAKPSADLFRQAYLTMQPEQPKPPAPAQCKTVRDIKAPEITKPNAEAYCNGQPGVNDPRGNRPLLILKKSAPRGTRLNVLASNGKTVGCFKAYGPYQAGLTRWYMGDCSGQSAAQLYDALGSEWGYLDLGSGNCLRFNSIRRQGVYR